MKVNHDFGFLRQPVDSVISCVQQPHELCDVSVLELLAAWSDVHDQAGWNARRLGSDVQTETACDQRQGVTSPVLRHKQIMIIIKVTVGLVGQTNTFCPTHIFLNCVS